MRPCIALALLWGCVDKDDDGLRRSEERRLGLDDTRADTDEDGLDDNVELEETNTDPLHPDSDGDGYLDGDEVTEDRDPNDADDVIYVGGWPYVSDKDAIGGQSEDGMFREGERVPRLGPMPDQFGDDVDLYDFYDPDGPLVVLQLSTLDCVGCRDLADWLGGGEMPAMKGREGLRDAVTDGAVRWLHVIVDTEPDAAAAWHERHAMQGVPVFVDVNGALAGFVDPYTVPTLVVLAPDLSMFFRGDAPSAAREVETLGRKL